MADIVRITSDLDAIDLKKITEYTRKLSDIGNSFNKMMAPTYLRDFIIAFDISSAMLAKALQAEAQAKSAVETAEAIAFLDKAPDYFKVKGEKPTVESRKAYVALDPDVQIAKDVHARSLAMVSFLKNKVIEFRDAHQIIKQLSYQPYSDYEGMK